MNIRTKIFGTEETGARSPLLESKKPKGAKTDMLLSIPVEREEHRRGNTRCDDRHRLPQQEVQVRYNGRMHDVQLINLSGGGAMVSGDLDPLLWDRIDLHLAPDGVIECAVRWLKGDRIGLEFAHETRLDCSSDEQAQLLRAVIANNLVEIDYEGPATAPSAGAESDDKRDARRHPLIWSGVVHYDFDSSNVRLRNISSSGALVELSDPLPVGAEPLLDLGGGGSIFATVTWVVGDQAGLKFHRQFDMTQLANARPEIAPAKWERPNYLNAGTSADSPWAPEWERMSLGELKDQLDGFMKR